MPFYIRNNKFLVTPNNRFSLSCGGTPDPSCCFFDPLGDINASRVAAHAASVLLGPSGNPVHPDFGLTSFSGTINSSYRFPNNDGEDLIGDFEDATSVSPVRGYSVANPSGGFCTTEVRVSAVLPNSRTLVTAGVPGAPFNASFNFEFWLTLGKSFVANTPLIFSIAAQGLTASRGGCTLSELLTANFTPQGYLLSEVTNFSWPSPASPNFVFSAAKNRNGIVATTDITFNVQFRNALAEPIAFGSCPNVIAQILDARGCPPAAQAVQGSGDCGCGCGDCG